MWGQVRGYLDLVVCGIICLGIIGCALCIGRAYAEDGPISLSRNLVLLFAGHGILAMRLLCFFGLLFSLRAIHERCRVLTKSLLARWSEIILEPQSTRSR